MSSTATDTHTIRRVNNKIASLRENKALFTNMKVSFKWSPGIEEQTNFESFPTMESIKAGAMDIRHFTAPGSPLIMGKLVRYLREQPSIDINKLDEFYKIWREQTGDKPTKRAPMGHMLNMDGKDLTLKEQIDLWMNGELFHMDDEKSKKLERMYFSTFRDQSWMIFVSTLQNLSRLLFYFDKQFLGSK